MNYQEQYQQKLCSAEEVAALVKSDSWIDYGWVTGAPVKVDAAIAKRLPELHNVNFHGGILLHEPEIFKIDHPEEHITFNSWHSGGFERRACTKGYGFYAPIRYSELPRYYDDMDYPTDLTVIQVTPMNKHGYFNFGPCASHLTSLIARSKKVAVEINENMPLCLGSANAYVHIDQVDMIVEGDNPPIDELPGGGPATDIDKAVAKLIVAEIPDGACLQLGIGGMPNAIGEMIAQSDLKDLGVHTEMYVDGFVDIANAGKITGRRKNIDPGLQTYAFAAGTKKLYDYLDDNPGCMSTDVRYTNSSATISKLDNFISINNAVDVDLFGQINSESAGTRHISGAGGQLDFVIGAYESKGGKSFVCLSSTFMDKKTGTVQSRIRPTLSNGSIVTDTRTNANYIVTEYGIANMKGLSTWQRAEALINIAHPDFRDELIREAEKMNIWKWSNKR